MEVKNKSTESNKRAYEAPKLEELGSFGAMTSGPGGSSNDSAGGVGGGGGMAGETNPGGQ